MDYTTLAIVQSELGTDGTTYTAANTLLSQHITTASRVIDRITSGGRIDAVDYLKTETKTLETLYNSIADNMGTLMIYPHKPLITTVSAIQWRVNPSMPWQTANMTMVDVLPNTAKLWQSGADQGRITVQISYSGGLGATQADLPFDIVQVATELAVRMYREAKSGLTDVLGVVDTGILFYQKAIPATTQTKLTPFIRVTPW